MKYILFAVLSTLSFFSIAQNEITIDSPTTPLVNAVITMRIDSQGFIIVLIPQSTLKDTRADWISYAGKGSKGKSVATDGLDIQYEVANKNIAPEPFDLSSRLLETIGGVRLTVWFTSNNTLLTSQEQMHDRDLALQKYVRDFAVIEYKRNVHEELKAGQNKQKAMESELIILIKDENKSGKRINDDQRFIQRSNDAIITSNNDIQSITVKIESQKGMVETTAADPNASKGAKKTLGELESQKRNLQKQNDKQGNRIENWNIEIKAERRAITDDKEKETSKEVDIEKQKQVVQGIKTKLEGIK